MDNGVAEGIKVLDGTAVGEAVESIKTGVTIAVTGELCVSATCVESSTDWQASSATSRLNNHKLDFKADFLNRKLFRYGMDNPVVKLHRRQISLETQV